VSIEAHDLAKMIRVTWHSSDTH